MDVLTEAVAMLKQQLAEEESLVVDRIKRLRERAESDAEREWYDFHVRTLPIRKEIERLVENVVKAHAHEPMPPVVMPATSRL